MTPKKHTKEAELIKWRALNERQNPLPFMDVIPYKATGSRYGACGIRIDGNPAFIDAVLSNLRDLLAGEGVETRLELARHVVDGSGIGKDLPNAGTGAEVCYIRLHQRGREGAMLQAIIQDCRDRHPKAANDGMLELSATG
jgi:hypothetical protein